MSPSLPQAPDSRQGHDGLEKMGPGAKAGSPLPPLNPGQTPGLPPSIREKPRKTPKSAGKPFPPATKQTCSKRDLSSKTGGSGPGLGDAHRGGASRTRGKAYSEVANGGNGKLGSFGKPLGERTKGRGRRGERGEVGERRRRVFG